MGIHYSGWKGSRKMLNKWETAQSLFSLPETTRRTKTSFVPITPPSMHAHNEGLCTFVINDQPQRFVTTRTLRSMHWVAQKPVLSAASLHLVSPLRSCLHLWSRWKFHRISKRGEIGPLKIQGFHQNCQLNMELSVHSISMLWSSQACSCVRLRTEFVTHVAH